MKHELDPPAPLPQTHTCRTLEELAVLLTTYPQPLDAWVHVPTATGYEVTVWPHQAEER